MQILKEQLKGKQFLIYKHFQELIETDKFDEYDVLAFLIYIRSKLPSSNNNYPYVQDFCDWIAHPQRDRGIAYSAIIGAINSAYRESENKKVIGYHGIEEEQLLKQWKSLFSELEIKVTKLILKHFIACTFSLVQDTLIQINSDKYADVTLMVIKSDQTISLNTRVQNNTSPTVVFAQIHGIETNTDIVGKLIQIIRNDDGVLTIVDQDRNVLAFCK